MTRFIAPQVRSAGNPRSGTHGGLRDSIAAERRRIARLEIALREAEARLEAFEAQLAAHTPRGAVADGKLGPADKLALFQSRFRGRADVFPRLWRNDRTGRKGYAPA